MSFGDDKPAVRKAPVKRDVVVGDITATEAAAKAKATQAMAIAVLETLQGQEPNRVEAAEKIFKGDGNIKQDDISAAIHNISVKTNGLQGLGLDRTALDWIAKQNVTKIAPQAYLQAAGAETLGKLGFKRTDKGWVGADDKPNPNTALIAAEIERQLAAVKDPKEYDAKIAEITQKATAEKWLEKPTAELAAALPEAAKILTDRAAAATAPARPSLMERAKALIKNVLTLSDGDAGNDKGAVLGLVQARVISTEKLAADLGVKPAGDGKTDIAALQATVDKGKLVTTAKSSHQALAQLNPLVAALEKGEITEEVLKRAEEAVAKTLKTKVSGAGEAASPDEMAASNAVRAKAAQVVDKPVATR